MNETLLYILIAANTPLYFLFGKWTFEDWEGFGRSAQGFFTTLFGKPVGRLMQLFGAMDDIEEVEERFKFLWWLGGCVVTVAAEYYGITKIFHV